MVGMIIVLPTPDPTHVATQECRMFVITQEKKIRTPHLGTGIETLVCLRFGRVSMPMML
jgi:hypothetical protein